jgi:hypothetical protein
VLRSATFQLLLQSDKNYRTLLEGLHTFRRMCIADTINICRIEICFAEDTEK